MTKKIIGFVLAVALILAGMTGFALVTARAADPTPLTQDFLDTKKNPSFDRYDLEAGEYILNENIRISKRIIFNEGNASINLNGNTMTFESGGWIEAASVSGFSLTIKGSDGSRLVGNGANVVFVPSGGSTLTIESGVVEGGVSIGGSFKLMIGQSGSLIIPNDRSLATTNSTVNIINNGNVTNNGTINNCASITNNGTVINRGNIVNGYTTSLKGEITNNNTIVNEGTITNNSNATIKIASGASIENSSGATITNDGTIDGSGTLTDNGTYTGNEAATIVNRPVRGVTLDAESLDLKVGDTGTVTAEIIPVNATGNVSVIWSSDNEGVATVEADKTDGKKATVTAKGAGTATITAKVGDIEVTYPLTVAENASAAPPAPADTVALVINGGGDTSITDRFGKQHG